MPKRKKEKSNTIKMMDINNEIEVECTINQCEGRVGFWFNGGNSGSFHLERKDAILLAKHILNEELKK